MFIDNEQHILWHSSKHVMPAYMKVIYSTLLQGRQESALLSKSCSMEVSGRLESAVLTVYFKMYQSVHVYNPLMDSYAGLHQGGPLLMSIQVLMGFCGHALKQIWKQLDQSASIIN